MLIKADMARAGSRHDEDGSQTEVFAWLAIAQNATGDSLLKRGRAVMAALVLAAFAAGGIGRSRPALLVRRRAQLRISIVLLLALLAQPVLADDRLWQALATEPGLVVLMRHTQPAGGHPLTWDPSGNCAGESLLTAAGRAHARKIGEAFANRGIKPVVISSPMCRCRDTAQIAFGRAPLTDGALREIASADPRRATEFERRARSLIAGNRGVSPVAFVSHRPNIDLLTLELIAEGELLVARSDEAGELTVLGRIEVQP